MKEMFVETASSSSLPSQDASSTHYNYNNIIAHISSIDTRPITLQDLQQEIHILKKEIKSLQNTQ